MGETTFLDSSGVGWLLGCNKRFRQGGGSMVLHTVPPIVLDMLKVMRLEQVLKIADDEPAAVSIMRGEPV
jgi:anti-anti-sigma factor